ncbi:MAG: hypothetical protein JSV19_02865 [Phycisphaerales bacterium]|nr:MAG: hypothetical protein JSV19_02865 [Phycisphaerales bacterium]
MIEFKAECGHTVRVKDEDSGKVVRCSYCGRETQAPEKGAGTSDLEYLFSEVEKTGAYDTPSDQKRLKRMRGKSKGAPLPKSDGGLDPFSVVLKICYLCAVVVVLIWVGKTVYRQVTTPETVPGRRGVAGKQPGGSSSGTPASAGKVGLLQPRLSPGGSGIYVNSVPGGAEVFVTVKGAVRKSESVLRCRADQLACTLRSGEIADRLSPGNEYDIYVALRINDPNLMKLPGYAERRRAHEVSGNDNLFEDYFLPDGAVGVMTDTLPNAPMKIVRKYECRVFERTWSPVIALFLPDLPLADLLRYLPVQKTFGFNEDEVGAELEFHGIGSTDRKYMIDILRRIGIAPYRDEDTGLYRIFAISLTDGSIYCRPGRFRHQTDGAPGLNVPLASSPRAAKADPNAGADAAPSSSESMRWKQR